MSCSPPHLLGFWSLSQPLQPLQSLRDRLVISIRGKKPDKGTVMIVIIACGELSLQSHSLHASSRVGVPIGFRSHDRGNWPESKLFPLFSSLLQNWNNYSLLMEKETYSLLRIMHVCSSVCFLLGLRGRVGHTCRSAGDPVRAHYIKGKYLIFCIILPASE